MKISKHYRLSEFRIKELEFLKKCHPTSTETELIEEAIHRLYQMEVDKNDVD